MPSAARSDAMAHRHDGSYSCDGRLLSAFCRTRTFEVPSPAMSLAAMRIDVGAQYGVHARQMPVTLLLEPLENIAIDAQMH
jgi:hypothetical protein